MGLSTQTNGGHKTLALTKGREETKKNFKIRIYKLNAKDKITYNTVNTLFKSYLVLRSVGFVEKEIKKANISTMDTGENPEVPFPRDMIDLEVSSLFTFTFHPQIKTIIQIYMLLLSS